MAQTHAVVPTDLRSPPPTAATPEDLELLRGLVKKHGITGAARLLGVGRSGFLAVMTGLPVRAGTLALTLLRARQLAGVEA